MSLWVKVANSFYTHRKTARLRVKLGNDALWLPPRLWAYAAEYHPDGVLGTYDPNELANLLGYTGDASSMLQAMLVAGFLDPDPLRIHGWEEHNGYHATFAARAKKAAQVRWSKQNGFSPHLSSVETRREEGRREEASNASGMLGASVSSTPHPHADANARVGVRMFPREIKDEIESLKGQQEALKRKYETEPSEAKAALLKEDIHRISARIEELQTAKRGFPLASGETPEPERPKKSRGPNI
jgi:hypothetical protein